jgi:hypothetical protein
MPATTIIPGIVRSIAAVSSEYAPSERNPRLRIPVPGTAVLAPKESADGWEKDHGDQSFVAYLLDVDDQGSG